MNFPRRKEATNKELILTIINIQGYLMRYGESHTNWHETLNEVIERLEQQSTVTPPEPKTGHWIPHTDRGMIEYSECHAEERIAHLLHSNFCPNCGYRMIELQESEVEDGNN